MITVENLPEFGNLPIITIANKNASARISLMGAHLLSFIPAGGEELLFISKKSWFEEGKPIRSGVPVCWPWFAGNAIYGREKEPPKHGLARLRMWELINQSESDNGEYSEVTLQLQVAANDFWPGDSMLSIRFGIGKRLSIDTRTVNCSTKALTLTQALHTYFYIGDVQKIAVTGLEGRTYRETATSFEHPEYLQQQGAITVASEVDRVYENSANDVAIEDYVLKRRIRISKGGSNVYVVWNPWIKKSIEMEDFGEEEYHKMICVESVNAFSDRIELQPGDAHVLSTVYSIEPL